MGATDGSTVGERVTVVGQLLGRQGDYGVVTALSREVGVARQTLDTWRERAFAPPTVARSAAGALERAILTLLVDGPAGERGIQRSPLRGAWRSTGKRWAWARSAPW